MNSFKANGGLSETESEGGQIAPGIGYTVPGVCYIKHTFLG
jgi:hypothetical protein